MFDWSKPVFMVNWNTDEVIREYNARMGLGVMTASDRWDDQHATANVRTLDGITPVTFTQDKPEHTGINWAKHYGNGACPDCFTKIPADTENGGNCQNCDHVLWAEIDQSTVDPNA